LSLSKLENILEKINLDKEYNLLTKREKKIISLYYLEGYTDEEIARLYGVCQQVINRQRRKGIIKLKNIKNIFA
jgi:RNA polymerase sigma factor (sigma-70 family)